MTEGVNKVYLMGNLGADAELQRYATGSRLTFRVATTESWKDKEGGKQERTEWHRCTLWGERAEKLAPHLAKGTALFVEGRLEHRSYEKQGQTRYATEIRVRELKFAGSGRRDVAATLEPLNDAPTGGDYGDVMKARATPPPLPGSPTAIA